jgi:glucan phosphorylase
MITRQTAGTADADKRNGAISNTARSGKFSSDRAIAEYCDEIWNV